jgi:hypothetical protein
LIRYVRMLSSPDTGHEDENQCVRNVGDAPSKRRVD